MSWATVDEAIDLRALWRALIDNARAESVQLTDNELAALLMTLAGYSTTQIGPVLENHQGTGYLTQTRAQQLVQSAFTKTLRAGGIQRRADFTMTAGRGRPRK